MTHPSSLPACSHNPDTRMFAMRIRKALYLMLLGGSQFAEGEPGNLLVVNIEVTGDAIRFAVREGETHAGSFSGSISGDAIHGEFRYANRAVEKVVLKKGKSYWD